MPNKAGRLARLLPSVPFVAGALSAGWLLVKRAQLGTGSDAGSADSGGNAGKGDRPRVVILGGGFAGLTIAGELARRGQDVADVLLVDRHNYHLFTPMLYQAATLGVNPYTVAYPLRQFLEPRGVAFRCATVAGADFSERRVHADSGDIPYDYLVIALGTTTNFFGNESACEHTFPLKWLEDGVAIRNRLVDCLEQATVTADEEEKRALLTFVVVGGGATGVETAAALATLIEQVLHTDYPSITRSQTRLLVIESEGKLLGHMGSRMADLALKRLRGLGVEVWLNSEAKDVTPDSVATGDGKSVRSHTILWATGVKVPDVVSKLEAEHDKGGSLKVNEYLQVCGQTGVYAAGDNSHFEDAQTHKAAPLLAQAAVEEGRTVAKNIARAIEG